MARVLSPNKEYTGVSCGVEFKNGVAECDNPVLLDWFKRRGYEVKGYEAPQDPAKTLEKPLSEMTKPELQAIVAKEEIAGLNAKSTKEEIIAAIEAHRAEKTAGDNPPPPPPAIWLSLPAHEMTDEQLQEAAIGLEIPDSQEYDREALVAAVAAKVAEITL